MIWQVDQKSLILELVLFTTSALAVNCTTVSVKSENDAEILRQSCPIITGDLTIGPFPQNVSSIHINLDGIEFINGSIKHDAGAGDNFEYLETPFTVSSSTLLKVGGSVIIGGADDDVCNMKNLSVPNLAIVSGLFWIGVSCPNLTYLDITSLDYADYIQLAGNNLTTLRHTKLSNVNGLSISETPIDSVDSLFNNPLNITDGATLRSLPNVKNVTIGFRSANELSVSAKTTVILGGSSATEMSVKSVSFSELTGLKRSLSLEFLTADTVTIEPTGNVSQIYLPFDDLRVLSVQKALYPNASTLRLPANAVNWTGGFEFDVDLSPGLNLSSMYGLDEQGNNIQTWYWPTDVSSIRIFYATIANPFLYVHIENFVSHFVLQNINLYSDTFVAQQNGSTEGTTSPSVLSDFDLTPASGSHLNCTTFDNLRDMDRLPQSADVTAGVSASIAGYHCESLGVSGSPGRSHRVPSLISIIGIVFGMLTWGI